MKISYTKTFFLFYILMVYPVYTQVTDEQKQKWIQDLYSDDEDTVQHALLSISENDVPEALPAIETNYYKVISVSLKQLFLSRIASYNSPNAPRMINNFIDSVKYFMIKENRSGRGIYYDDFSDTIYYQIHTAQYLLDIGDYSRVQLIVDDIQTPKPHSFPLYWVQIYNERPEYANILKPKIIQYINDSTTGTLERSRLLYDLRKKQGSAFFPDLLDFTRTSPDPWIRHIVLFQLVEMNYPNVLALLEERFLQDSYSTMKREIAETLLTRYGSINEYAFLKNNIGAVSRPIVAEMIQDRLKEFIPPKPSAMISVFVLLDSLKSYIVQSQNYNWLGNSYFVTELTKKLDEAKKHLTKKHADVKDSIKCAKEVRKFQKKVNEVYEETLEKGKKHEHHKEKFVTVEGWKFLYYNAQYILDRLPALKKEQEEED